MKALKTSGCPREYRLLIDEKDLEEILNLNSDSGIGSNYTEDGMAFRIYHDPTTTDESFRLMPGEQEYYMCIGGVEIKDKENLKRLISNLKRIPMQIYGSSDKMLTIGHVYPRLI